MMFWNSREELTGKVRCRAHASRMFTSDGLLLQVECLKIHTYSDHENGGAPVDRVANAYWRDATASDLNDLGPLMSNKEILP